VSQLTLATLWHFTLSATDHFIFEEGEGWANTKNNPLKPLQKKKIVHIKRKLKKIMQTTE